MKKIILSVAAVFAFGFANAQDKNESSGFSKGSMFLSGNISYDSTKEGDLKSNQLTFSPTFGYFLTEDIALGGRLNVLSGEDEDKTKTTEFGLELFGRKYWTASSQFSLFGELAVGFGSGKEEPAVGGENKYKAFGVNAGIGVNYFISSAWALEAKWAALGYNSLKFDGADDAATSFGLGADLSNISLGLLYKF
ncbi:outer membrane beta-barrel protein [Flavobacterium macrobrachii]|jgi:opacity protein-like surface antigen|uniref:outer membrane beta-barrel protein n=1 Tax=Flavobacterium macrobrachii TaxID=591204 RepID=UPI0037C09B07